MDYGKVYHRFWKSRTVRAWDDQARSLALYLLTSQHSTSEGYFHLPIAYAAADLGWDIQQVEKAFAQLDADDFARYDPDAEVVLVVKAIQWNEPKSETQVKGAINKVNEAPLCGLLTELCASADGMAQGLVQGLRGLADPIDTPLNNVRDPHASSSSNSSSSSSSSKPPQTPPDKDAKKASKSTPGTTRPLDGWEPNDTHRRLAAEVGADLSVMVPQFLDHHRSKGSAFKDWDAALRTWIRNSSNYGGAGTPNERNPATLVDGEELAL